MDWSMIGGISTGSMALVMLITAILLKKIWLLESGGILSSDVGKQPSR